MAQTQTTSRGIATRPPLPCRPSGHQDCNADSPPRERVQALAKAYVEKLAAMNGVQVPADPPIDDSEETFGLETLFFHVERKKQAGNCYIDKMPIELLAYIEQRLPTVAKICLRRVSARFLQLSSEFPGWDNWEHHDTYQKLVNWYKDLSDVRENEKFFPLGLHGCSYCKDTHIISRFSAQELDRDPSERKCLGADTTQTLRISHDVNLTWAEFMQYFGKEKHVVMKQCTELPNNLYAWKWSHIIHTYRTPVHEHKLAIRYGNMDLTNRMFLGDHNITINTRYDDAVVIVRHIPLGTRTDMTTTSLAHTLANMGPEPICPHITLHDLLIEEIKPHSEPYSFVNLLCERPGMYEEAIVEWSGFHQCKKCPTMFWFMDGMARVVPRSDTVSLEIYREMPEFKREGDWNLTSEGVDGPGDGWLKYFTTETVEPEYHGMYSEFRYGDRGCFGADDA